LEEIGLCPWMLALLGGSELEQAVTWEGWGNKGQERKEEGIGEPKTRYVGTRIHSNSIVKGNLG